MQPRPVHASVVSLAAILGAMCGIAGMVGGGRPDPGVLHRMAEVMAHRGPDGQGTWGDDECGLAFRRLAIIDLDPRSDQPLHLGPWHLVFNGEIYNYRELRQELEGLGHTFVTAGDGEVLLHAWAEWGERALDRFNGMFAFGIWHDERRELMLASDPFGEKPLYWARDGERLVFASDIRAIAQTLRLGGADTSALGPFLALGVMPDIERSFFTGVNRLPGAHVLRFREGNVSVRRYWTPGRVDVPTAYPAAVARLRELLADSIALRLRADVPVGTSLSGGIDSSAIVSLVGGMAPGATRHAFTARFPGFERDEWSYAEQVAAGAGVVEHHAIEPSATEMLDDLDRLVADQEEPFGSLSIYVQWRVMRAAREAGVTVLLDGQGADELFGGYDGIIGWAMLSQGTPSAVRSAVAGPRRGALARALAASVAPRPLARRYRATVASPYASVDRVGQAVMIEPPDVRATGTPLRRELLRQALHTSLPGLLRYADRNSMAHSREVRLPFLDRRIAEFALSAPAGFLYRDGYTKAVLRDAVRDIAPASVLARRDKVGYEPPQARWLTEPAAVTRIRDVLLDPTARARGLYDTDRIANDAEAGRWRDPAGIWRALNIELWLQALDGELGPPRRGRPRVLSGGVG